MTLEWVIELGQKFPETVPKSYASLKIPPYEAEFIFRDLRMTLDSGRDLAENGTLQKNTPLRSGIYFL